MTDGDASEVRDPREGQAVLALWDYVYDFDGDVGGFATGQFLLRADGALWIRTGGSSWSGPDRTFYRYRPWRRWPFLTEPVDVAGAYAAVHRHHYTVYPPGPVPIDVEEGGPYADGGLTKPLTASRAGRWVAPSERAAGRVS